MLSFKGRHFPKDLILMAVRWKVAYPLSYRHIEELQEERGADVDHSTVQKWVVHYAPKLEQSFRKRKKPVGRSWKMDETYIKVNGKWVYLYRAVDNDGATIDFMLSETRDRAAVLRFFKKAIGASGFPEKVNIDKSGANTAALERINNLLFLYGLWPLLIDVRRIKYLNNRVEQDHRGIKNITKYTLGFKSFETAEATIAGIELHRMLKKGQLENAGDTPAWKQFYSLAA
ncbi:IS6 family transposase [Yersinia ruckeri]|uniref:IS6 family transposase n=1 Tax=Yersinia ruckeri TaxID=29486 RepID=UPI001F3502E5|nr:IS6 family transposase [Yersinia ruckeri]UIN02547.1 IS6 family transposase [Yersinia ruckeri]